MPRHTLLLSTYHFPPSAAVAVYRMLGLVRYLPDFDWRVVVVAPPEMPDEPVDPALFERVPAGTTVVHVPFPHGGIAVKGARRLLGTKVWLWPALAACHEVIRDHKPDVILTSSPPPAVHYLGLFLKKRYGLPWVACLRDPWVLNHPKRVKIRPFERPLERSVLGRSDAVVANTPLNLRGLTEAYPGLRGKTTIVPNGFDPENFAGLVRMPTPPEKPLLLLHAGEIYSGRDPRPLLAALQTGPGSTAPDWEVDFLGRSTEGLCDLPAEIRSRGLENRVRQTPQVPYAQALQRMVQADALLLIHTPGVRLGVPAKLYEYLGAGRPILALAEPEGDIAWVLRTSGVPHRVVPALDTAAIRQALADLAVEIRAHASAPAVGDLDAFTRRRMAWRMACCLDSVLQAHRRKHPVRLQDFVP